MVNLSEKMEKFVEDLTTQIGTVVKMTPELKHSIRRVCQGSYDQGFNDALALLKEAGHINIH